MLRWLAEISFSLFLFFFPELPFEPFSAAGFMVKERERTIFSSDDSKSIDFVHYKQFTQFSICNYKLYNSCYESPSWSLYRC